MFKISGYRLHLTQLSGVMIPLNREKRYSGWECRGIITSLEEYLPCPWLVGLEKELRDVQILGLSFALCSALRSFYSSRERNNTPDGIPMHISSPKTLEGVPMLSLVGELEMEAKKCAESRGICCVSMQGVGEMIPLGEEQVWYDCDELSREGKLGDVECPLVMPMTTSHRFHLITSCDEVAAL